MSNYQALYEETLKQLKDSQNEVATLKQQHADFVKEVLTAANVTNGTISTVKDILNRVIVDLDNAKLIVRQAQPAPKTAEDTEKAKKVK